MPQQAGGSQMSSPAVRLAAVLPAVPGEPGSALGPRGSRTAQHQTAPPSPAVHEPEAAPAGSGTSPIRATSPVAEVAAVPATAALPEVRATARPAARTGGAVARAAATWRGGGAPAARGAVATEPYAPPTGAVAAARADEPPGGRPNRPLLAAAAIAGTVLIGTPFLFLGLGSDEERNQAASVREVPVGGTVVENLAPNGGQSGNDYATAAPSRKPVPQVRPVPQQDRRAEGVERPGTGPNTGPEEEKRTSGRTGTDAGPATGGDAGAGEEPRATEEQPVSPRDTGADKKAFEQDGTPGQDKAREQAAKGVAPKEGAAAVALQEQAPGQGHRSAPAQALTPALLPAAPGKDPAPAAPAEKKEAEPEKAAPAKEAEAQKPAPKEAKAAPVEEKAPEAAKPAPEKETAAAPVTKPVTKPVAKPAARAGGALPQSANFATVRNVPLKNAMTGMCADVPNYGKGTVDGPVNQFTCNTTAADNQLWDLVVSRPGAGPGGADLFTIRNSKDGLCLDLPNYAGQPAGTGVSEFHCRPTSADNQLWYLDKRSDGKFWIRSHSSAGRCLDVSGYYGSGGKDARLTIFECNKRDDHVWSFS
ncbi:RICIN domain-containing protein [Streptomyces antarcticus]|uniref:RICIN domain-containing protein n=1 Tax=Streptomyces antarcticus TaxID=2996458 RepID=UPI00227126AC|nr:MULTISPECIES: RICIN domain-containing protein [unclassified Streptomyces]MCY0941817.1 RICIN domain-containing protein [Streptomyces sp. H34-AA3]MCZ4087836.1 RICIN domain-containing protein [Streptomyces sp. H34-S5]